MYKNNFSASNSFMHMFNMPVMRLLNYQISSTNTLRQVDFTMHALSQNIQNPVVKNPQTRNSPNGHVTTDGGVSRNIVHPRVKSRSRSVTVHSNGQDA